MLYFQWSLIILRFSALPFPVPSFWEPFQIRQWPLVSRSLSFSIAVFFSFLARSRFSSLFSFSLIFFLWSAGTVKSLFSRFLSFFKLSLDLVFRLGLGDFFVSQNPRKLCVSHSSGRIEAFAIPFGKMVKYKLLVQFPLDHTSHPVVSCLELFLCLLYSPILLLIASSLLPQYTYLLFCCLLNIIALK